MKSVRLHYVLFTLGIVPALLLPGAIGVVDAAAGLLAGYSLDAGAGPTAADASGHGLTGTLVGATWTAEGKYGSALTFNGSTQYVDLGNPAALQLTGSATWSAWVKASANPADDGQVIAKSDSTSGWQFKTSPDTGPHTFAIALAGPTTGWVQRNSATVRALNTWYHVAAVYNAPAATLDIFVNGVLDNGILAGTVPTSQINSAAPVSIGRRLGNSGYHFAGVIDEVRVYERPLSATEIAADMAAALGGPDTQAPTAPDSAAATVVGATRIDVSWAASTDNVGVTGYQLERCAGSGCSSFAQIVAASATSFSDTTVAPGTSYSYRVRATDAATNLSAYSNVASAATPSPDTQAPTAPGTPAPTVVSSTRIDLTWPAATDNLAVTGYLLERCAGAGCSTFTQIAVPGGTSFSDTGLSPSTSYHYRVQATDAASNLSVYSGIASATTAAAPGSLLGAYPFNEGSGTTADDVSGSGLTGTLVGATWTTAGKYGNALAFDGSTQYVNLGNPSAMQLTGSATWSAWIKASGNPLDDGQIVAKSDGTVGWQFKTSPDTGPHTFAIAVFGPTTGWVQRNSATVRALNTWYHVAAVYNAPAASLDIYVNGVLDNGILAGIVPTSQVDAPVNVNIGRRTGNHGYHFGGVIDDVRVYNRALSAAEIQADMNTPLGVVVPDTEAPSAPGAPVPSVVSSTRIDLTWPAATDNVGVTGYVVERCAGAGCISFAPTATPSGTSYSDTGLAPSTSYSYRVRAVDAATNVSAHSGVASATTTAPPDTEAPTAPGTPLPTVVSSTQIDLTWPAATDNVAVTGYVLERCAGAGCSSFAPIAALSATSYSDTGLSPSTAYSYRVRAVDAATNVSAHSGVASAPTPAPPDTEAPTAPGPPVPSVVSSTQIDLTWPAATDNIGVTGYVLERCAGAGCSSFALIAAPSGTSYSDSGLLPSTSYGYRVRATDAASNLSAYSGVASATTSAPPDTEAPTAPGPPVPSVVSSTQIDLTWPAATDNVAVTGYVLERCAGAGCGSFAPIATPSGTSHSDTGLAPSTSYSYRVRAVDAATNVSAHSGMASATTAAPPDTEAPTTPGTPVPTVVSSTQVDLTWPAATDNVAVTGYVLERCAGAGCSNFAPTATPSGTLYSDTGLAPSTSYSYRVRAVDAATNVSAHSGVASATTPAPPDTEVPTAPGTPLPTVVSSTQIDLTWPAATDNVAVTGYVLERCAGAGCISFAPTATPSGTSYSDTGLAPSTSYSYRVRAVDAATNVSAHSGVASATTTAPPDTEAPTTPGTPVPTVVSSTQIDLTWPASTDNIGVTGYVVERCAGAGCSSFAPIATPSGTSHSDTGLSPSTDYSYRVRAIDAATNASAHSGVASAPTPAPPDTEAPTAPGPPVPSVVSSTQIDLTWPAATDNIGVTGYVLERCAGAGCSSFALIAAPSGTSYSDSGLLPSTSYGYRVRATDAASNLSAYSGVASATTSAPPDTEAPTAPGTPLPTVVSSTQIDLTWPAATDNVAVTGYVLERCAGAGCGSFAPIATPSGTSHSDTGLSPSTSYSYRVRAVDAATNASAHSGVASATTAAPPDTEAPTTPGTPVPTVISSTQVDLTWPASTDNIGVTGYVVERCAGAGCSSFAPIATPSGTSYSDTGLSASTSYSYRVRAMDAATNVSAHSAVASATTAAPPDTEGPTAPGAPVPTVISSTQIDLTWPAATDNVAVTGYVLERCAGAGCSSFAPIATPSGTSYSDTGLSPSTSYSYRVRAVDAATNVSAHSGVASAMTLAPPDTEAPIAPGAPVPTVVSSTQIDVTWSASTDNVGVTGYLLERCAGAGCSSFTPIAAPSATSYSDTGLSPSTAYSYRVRAVDAATNVSAHSAVATATTPAPPDTEAPTAPGAPVPTVISSTQIDLTWPAATDNVAVTGYVLERCAGAGCSSFAPIATPSGTSYSDTGLSASTSYSYRVRAVDAATNVSAHSGVASATTPAPPDTEGPTAPGAPVPTVVSSTQIDVTWSASTDNVGVTGYLLERCAGAGCSNFAPIATPSGTSYSDTALLPSTSYSYRVRAVDAATNVSAHSGVASATTPAPPDTEAPTAPGTPVPGVVSSTQIDLTWPASTDNAGVTGYVLERCAGAGCSSFAPIAAPSATSYSDTGLSPSTSYSYRVRAVDAATNVSAHSGVASAMTLAPPDTEAPIAPGAPVPTVVSSTQIDVTWSASTDNVGVTGYLLERCAGAGCSSFTPIAALSATSYSDTGLSPSTAYSYRVRAVDAATNVSAHSATASATTATVTSGLLAGYAFNEGGGTATADASGTGLTGTLVGATWTTGGQYANALAFNGSTQYVDLGSPAALQLTGSATWSAWIKASGNPLDDGQIIAKSDSTAGWQFKTSPDTGPHTFAVALFGPTTGWVQRNSATVRALNTWYHVSAVYNAPAASLDIYVNGVLDNGILAGIVPTSQVDAPVNVNIGRRTGNHGYHFGGVIDDVRVYNRALSAAEIQADMNTPLGVVVPDTQAPTAPGTPVPVVISSTQIDLTWPASTDNVGVTGYVLERCTGAGCSSFAPIATPSATSYSDTGLSPSTAYSYRVRAVDAATNVSTHSAVASATTPALPDTEAPTAPGTPVPTVVSSTQIDLTWLASQDNVAVTGYVLERCAGVGCSNFAPIAAPSGTSHSDTGLAPSTSYSYRVRAVDAATNVSAHSAVASATTAAPPDTEAPTAPGTPVPTVVSSTQIDLTWLASQDNVAVTGYVLERCTGAGCSSFAPIAAPSGTSHSDTGLSPSTDYSYRVRAVDAATNVSAHSATASATTPAPPDTEAPTAPGTPVPTVVSSTQIDLTWLASQDNVAVTGYVLERCAGVGCSNFAPIAAPSGTSHSDTGLAPATSYRYRVRAVDAATNVSAHSTDATATTPAPPDTEAPTVPGAPVPTVISSTQIDLTWPASTDNVGVTGYVLERCTGAGCSSFAPIATPSATSYSDTGLSPSTAYSYRVRAVDAATNVSTHSAVASATTPALPDTEAPTAPGTPVPTVVSSTQIDLTWLASQDNVAVTGYVLERCAGVGCSNFAPIAAPSGTSHSDTGLAPSTSYSYRVRAVDAATNVSAHSAVASATTAAPPDTEAPTAPGTPVPTVVSSTQIDLTWLASQDNVAVTGYVLERCTGAGCSSFAPIAAPSGTSHSDTGLSPSTDYSYRVRAVDAATNVSAHSATASATTPAPPDTEAPTAPGTPVPTVVSSTQIDLTWLASQDNVAVTGYVLERCEGAGCSSFAPIAMPSATSFSDTGLSPSTSYGYRVRATDAATNVSAHSAVAMATTQAPPDTEPPIAPGAPVPTVVSSTRIDLTWAPSTDNVAVTGYVLERCAGAGCSSFAQIATPSGSSFSDTGLSPSTSYGYRVRATDAASNLSAFSGVASAATAAQTAGLLAGYAFNEGGGTTTADASNTGLTGTLVGATWAADGKYGPALAFDGSTQYVDLGNPSAMQLTGSATWSAWIKASGNPLDDGQIVAKSDGTVGWQFKTSPDTGPHTFAIAVFGPTTGWVQRNSATVRALNTWSHVAAVYNAPAASLDIYVNGVLDNGILAGIVPTSQVDAPVNVNIGRRTGNHGFHFGGVIDDVRVYNRVLSAAEIQADMNTPLGVVVPDTEAPTPPGTPVPVAIGSTQINLSWAASTDNLAVTGYVLERCQGLGCSSFAEIAAPSGTSFNDTGRSPSTSYSYRVRATDAALNLSDYSGVATATTAAADTQAPSAPGTPSLLVTSSSEITVSWTASTDNETVTGYLVERCQGAGCSSFAQIAALSGTSFDDTGRSPSTSYTYRLRATDAASNLSGYSGAATSVTAAPGTARPVFVSETHSATDGCCGLEYNNSTLTLNVTGTDRLLMVAWHAEWDGGPNPAPTAPDPEAWTVTNNGVPGTVITETNGYTGGDGNRRFRIYYWLNPPLGINTIVVANPNTGPNELSVAALLFNNVDQTNPLGDIVLDVSTIDRTAESETVNTTTSDLVVHVIADALVTRGSLGPGETSVSVVNDGQHPWDGDASLWISTKPGADPVTTVSSSGWASRVLNGVAIVLQGSSTAGRVSVDSSGSYLVDHSNRPFFINGETAWSLLAQISREDVELFLENRRQKGFNVLLAMLISHLYTTNPPANFYGDQPFTTSGDFNTPNEAYFAHADWVINAAAAKGQVVMLAPLYVGYQCEDQGWCADMRNSSLATMRNWGRYVGNRYKDFPNIIWVIGGDADAVALGVQDKVQEFVAGLLEFDTSHVMTVHNRRGQSGASVWPDASWLTLNSVYTDKITYEQAASEYSRVPKRPAFLIESRYENEWESTPRSLRSQAYWAVLAGATSGHIFGNCPIAAFSEGVGACANPGWQNQLESPGSTTVALVGRLFNSRAFHDLVPDLGHQVVTAGYESGMSYAAAARTSDGATVIVYIPTSRTLTLDMTQIAGASARMWWFNPRTGESTLEGDFPTIGTRTVTPPDADDWVLVADNAALNLPAPGDVVASQLAAPTHSGVASDSGGTVASAASLSVTPQTATVTSSLAQQFTASVDTVTWSVDGVIGGSPEAGTITSAGLYTPPSTMGSHVVTATSARSTGSASATVYVTNHPGVFTYHNDNLRTGQNAAEHVLQPANVNTVSFGKIANYTLDGATAASPLYVANVDIPGDGRHNVVYVATAHNSVYAFDADGRSDSPLWHVSFLDAVRGVTTVPAAEAGECCDFFPEIGISGTPVIDPASGTLYVVAKTKESGVYKQKLHALDISTGAVKFGGPVEIRVSVPGTGAGATGGQIAFDPLRAHQRSALLLVDGVIYAAFGDHRADEAHGWLLGFDSRTLQLLSAMNTTPNGAGAGLLMGGGGPAADASGHVYVVTAAGSFDASTGGTNFGNTLLKTAPAGALVDYFTPFDWSTLNSLRTDLGSAGPLLLPDQAGGRTHLMVVAGKTGSVYLVDRDNLGRFNPGDDSQILHRLDNVLPTGWPGGGNRSTPVYFDGMVYFSADNDAIVGVSVTGGTLSPVSRSTEHEPLAGGALAISASGRANGILWVVDRSAGVLRAYNPANLAESYYDSRRESARDELGVVTHATAPVIVNGKVFVAAGDRLVVFGLLP